MAGIGQENFSCHAGRDRNEIRLNYVRWRRKPYSLNPLHPIDSYSKSKRVYSMIKKTTQRNWDWWRDKNKEKVLHDTE